ncbi:MAG: ankyrin repeat domain-containing protein [Tatlockia sp.]|nr:ankyrin repeat domain-containing protein [Tatlockia sp.]
MKLEAILKLQTAIELNDLDYIKSLLSSGRTQWIHTPLKDGLRAIHYAARHGRLEIVKLLLADFDLIDSLDSCEQTAILWAAVNNHVELVDFLANKGANLNLGTYYPQTKDDRKTPVHWATEKGHLATLICLLTHIADPQLIANSHLIHIAAWEGHWEIIKFILAKDPNLIKQKDDYQMTPLAYASAKGHIALLKHLIHLGADLIETKDEEIEGKNFDPIHWAIAEGQIAAFNYLITFYPNDYVIARDGSHYIHLAAKFGQLEIIKILLKKNPAYLEFKNRYNQTPLMIAAKEGLDEVVNYLLSEGADYSIATNDPESVNHKKTALQLALAGGHFKTANWLVLKICKQNEEAIILMIRNGEQALELMLERPALIKPLLKNSRIAKLINDEATCDTRVQPMQWYQPGRGRRLSFFGSIDKFEESSSRFEPVKKIASGKFGEVRLFKDVEGNNIAVKSPVNNFVDLPADKLEIEQIRIERELKFNQLAYPFDKNLISLYKDVYTNRLILPYFDGEEAHKFINKVKCIHNLAKVLLKIAGEIHRIHGLGILHGDLFKRNILIQNSDNFPNIRIIDFGRSYFLVEKIGPFTLSEKGTAWYPPEIFGNKPVSAHPNQDVYSFGYFIERVLNGYPLKLQLLEKFPCIEKFYHATQNRIPTERPNLESFCLRLEKEIEEKNKFHQESTTRLGC